MIEAAKDLEAQILGRWHRERDCQKPAANKPDSASWHMEANEESSVSGQCEIYGGELVPQCFNEYGRMSYCDVPLCNERAGCYNPRTNGTDYRGLARYTQNGFRCVNWDLAVAGMQLDTFWIEESDLTENYCRNPMNRERPWCFYADLEGNIQWNFCFIPACETSVLDDFMRIPNQYNTNVPGGLDWESTRFRDYIENMEEECARICVERSSFTCRQIYVSFTDRYCEWLEYGEYFEGERVSYRFDSDGDVLLRISTHCEGFVTSLDDDMCHLPLGMEAGWIADADIMASSYQDDDHAPYHARLHGNSAWIPHPNDSRPFIQATFPQRMVITALLVQGGGQNSALYTRELHIAYKLEGIDLVKHFGHENNDPWLLMANSEPMCVGVVKLPSPVWTHQMRVYPTPDPRGIALRLEFLGCPDSDCAEGIGISGNQIASDRISASSFLSLDHHPAFGRLDPVTRVGTGWIPDSTSNDPDPWWQLTLEYQGGSSLARLYFQPQINSTQIVQIHPTAWGGDYRCLKLELLGCEFAECADQLEDEGESDAIDTVSCEGCDRSTLNMWQLHTYASDGTSGCQFTGDRNKWLQVEFSNYHIVTGFVVQGGTSVNASIPGEGGINALIDDFTFQYQSDFGDDPQSGEWRRYTSDEGRSQVFSGLRDPFSPTTTILDRPTLAVRIRFVLEHDELRPTTRMRFKLLGCRLETPEQTCASHEILFNGYCLGVIENDERDACDRVFRPDSKPLLIKSQETQNFILSRRDQIAATSSQLVIGLSAEPGEDFVWADGTPVLYNNFAVEVDPGTTTTPSMSGERCAFINLFNCFQWETYNCLTSTRATVCQADVCSDLRNNEIWSTDGGKRCLFEAEAEVTWSEADDACRQRLARLPTAEDVNRLKLHQFFRESQGVFWISHKEASNNGSSLESICYVAEVPQNGSISVQELSCDGSAFYTCIRDISITRIDELIDVDQQREELNETYGYIEFHGFAPWYYTGKSFTVVLAVPERLSIRMDILSVFLQRGTSIEDEDGCIDTLRIRDLSGDVPVRVICGDLPGFNQIVSNHVAIELEMGPLTVEERGRVEFSIVYEAVDCTQMECGGSGCGETRLDYQDGVLMTSPFPSTLRPFSECEKTIADAEGRYLAVQFTDYRICSRGASGCGDKVTFTAPTWEREVVFEYEEEPPPLLLTDTSTLTVNLAIGLEEVSEGFVANVMLYDKPGCLASSLDLCASLSYTCVSSSGIITSPNYPRPMTMPYQCQWRVVTPKGSFIRFRFRDITTAEGLSCSTSSLRIMEEMRVDGFTALLAEVCSSSPWLNSTSIESSLNEVLIELNAQPGDFTMMLEYEAVYFEAPSISDPDKVQSCPALRMSGDSPWVYFEGACYQFVKHPRTLTWENAEAYCVREARGHLASILSEEEARFVHYNLITNWTTDGTSTYIGLGLRDVKGIFRWTDGSPMTYTDWYIPSSPPDLNEARPTNEPDGGILDGCVTIQLTSARTTALWHDIPCLAQESDQFICKVAIDQSQVSDISQMTRVELDYSHPSTSQMCPASMLTCGTGECVHLVYQCDGVRDCSNGSDETSCPDAESACSNTSFTCLNGSCIPISFYCDNVTHCADGSDEISCAPYTCSEFRCDNGRCIPFNQTCDLVDNCFDGSDEANCGKSSDTIFQCFNGDIHPVGVECDGIVDCIGSSAEDELPTCGYRTQNFHCTEPGSMRCSNGACADANATCIYDVTSSGYITGCRDVSHLRSCADFQCPDYTFKCPRSYCIPLRFRCNGVRDCIGGEDELDCSRFDCPRGTYRCHRSRICLQPSEICDGFQHCPDFDDEQFCGLDCPAGCFCSGLAFVCEAPEWNALNEIRFHYTAKKIIITGTDLALMSYQPKDIAMTTGTPIVETGDTPGVSTVTAFLPTHHTFLAELHLLQTSISNIPASAFSENADLCHLSLRGNQISTIDEFAFSNLTRLRILDLRNSGTPTNNDIRAALEQIRSLETIYADSFAFCCMLNLPPSGEDGESGCVAPTDQFSSCDDLLKDSVLRVFMWILGISALAGNLFVIGLRVVRGHQVETSRIQSRLITHLAVSDLFMGCYMLIIAGADLYFRGDYAIHADAWRQSVLCSVAGLMSALSSEVSVFIIMLISVDRILCIVFSHHREVQFSDKSSRIWLAVVWLCAFVLTVVPALPIGYFDQFYGRSSVCLGLPLTTDRPTGWEYSIAVFLGLNLVCFTVTAFSYVAIYVTVHKSAAKFSRGKQNSRHVKNGMRIQVKLATKMALIVGTDFICWMPIIIMALLSALGAVQIPADVYAWTAVFILPLNSSLNPYLYTLSTVWQRHRARRHSRLKADSESVRLTSQTTPYALREDSTCARFTSQCVLTPFNSPSENARVVPLSKYIEERGEAPSVVDTSLILRDVRKAVTWLRSKSAWDCPITEDVLAVQLNPNGEITRAFVVTSDPAVIAMLVGNRTPVNRAKHTKFVDKLMEQLKESD
ncbi:uncharacterized protein [Diadema setosum]|uniref:uncharacterized protein n=1 Tax=Diadema setosum TaxID=31175 RepID=UPI003B3B2252